MIIQNEREHSIAIVSSLFMSHVDCFMALGSSRVVLTGNVFW